MNISKQGERERGREWENERVGEWEGARDMGENEKGRVIWRRERERERYGEGEKEKERRWDKESNKGGRERDEREGAREGREGATEERTREEERERWGLTYRMYIHSPPWRSRHDFWTVAWRRSLCWFRLRQKVCSLSIREGADSPADIRPKIKTPPSASW